uniref:RRM domain-containing protein n=1 Tax=Eutreptiella gymnastica TaxID=73025 RepID=A0A7S1JA44_9EUGL
MFAPPMWTPYVPAMPAMPVAILEVPEDMAPALQAALQQHPMSEQHYVIQSIAQAEAEAANAGMAFGLDAFANFPTLECDLGLDSNRSTKSGNAKRSPKTKEEELLSQETNIYVSNLPRSITDAKFKSLCTSFGQVFSTKLLHREAPMPTIGFAQYTHAEMAEAALQKMNGMLYQGRQLKVRMAHRDKDKGVNNKPSANLYVSNLPKHYTETNLRGVFSVYGNIISLVVLRHPLTGKSRGIGLVRFSSVGEARRAKESLHGMTLQPNCPLEVKYAENDKDRSRRIARRQHPENEHIIPEALDMCQTIESYKKHLHSKDPAPCSSSPPASSVAQTPSVVTDPDVANPEDTDPDALFSALAKYAKLLIPLENPLQDDSPADSEPAKKENT